MTLTDDQAALLRDKYVLWERASREGPMDLRDYNRRAAEALRVALMIVSEYLQPIPAPAHPSGYSMPVDVGIGAPSPADCQWPAGATFGFHDEPGEHDPCYVIMPGGAMLPFNHHAEPGVDIARARFVQIACNAMLAAPAEARAVYPAWRPSREAIAQTLDDQGVVVPMRFKGTDEDFYAQVADAILALHTPPKADADHG